MGYSTGTATTVSGLLASLDTFLVDNGWTVDTITSTDKVYSSTGNDDREAINIRATDANESGAGLLDGHLGYGLSMHDYFATGKVADRAVVTFRAYQSWNTGANTGLNCAEGKWGRFAMFTRGNGRPTDYIVRGITTSDTDGENIWWLEGNYLWTPGKESTLTAYPGSTFWPRFLNCSTGYYTAVRYPTLSLVDGYAPEITEWSPKNHIHKYMSSPSATSHTWNHWVPVYVGDTMYLYGSSIDSTNVAPTPYTYYTWCSYNCSTATWAKKTAPDFAITPVNTSQGAICWDGNDYIYSVTNGANKLQRYSIAGNSWDVLTEVPDNQTYGELVYIPASESGFDHDRVYLMGNTTTCRYYDIVHGGWATAGTTGVMTNGAGELMNGDLAFLYYYGALAAKTIGMYKFADSSDSNNLTFPLVFYNAGVGWINRRVSDLHVNVTATMTYYFFCDKRHFKIAIKHDDGKWFWTYAGCIDPYNKAEIVKTTATSGTGAGVVVSVDQTPTVASGDLLMIIDPAGDYRVHTIAYGSTANTITFSGIGSAIPSGCIIGEDPQPVGVFSDDAYMWFPTNVPSYLQVGWPTSSTGGNNTGALPAGVEPFYDVTPLGRPARQSEGAMAETSFQYQARLGGDYWNKRTNKFSLMPLIVQQDRNYMPEIAERRGQLIGAYAVGENGRAVSEDIINVGGENYLYFEPTNGNLSVADTGFAICLGPMV